MRVAAVVVTYNRKALLRQCVDALKAQSHSLDKIIVVDNASADGTPAMVLEAYPEVELLELQENRGGAGGFHAGMKRATEQEADWIWVMDDDAEPKQDALEELFRPGVHQKDDTVAVTSLKVFPNSQPQFDQTGWYQPEKMKITPVDSSSEAVTEIGYGSFVGLLIRQKTVIDVGLPDPKFFIWYDDVEYCQRLNNRGQIFLVRNSKIIHHNAFGNSEEAGKPRGWRTQPFHKYWRSYYAHRNKLLIVRRHVNSPWGRWRGYLMGLWKAARSAVKVIVLSDRKKDRLRLVWRGLLHGLTGISGKQVDPDHY